MSLMTISDVLNINYLLGISGGGLLLNVNLIIHIEDEKFNGSDVRF